MEALNQTLTLDAFLLARIAELEALANQSVQIGDRAQLIAFGEPPSPSVLVLPPDLVLAECEAKRQIVERQTSHATSLGRDVSGCPDLRELAAIYADYPDYREEWRP